MKRTKTKILSVFLSFCMIISCMVGMSVTASADTKTAKIVTTIDDYSATVVESTTLPQDFSIKTIISLFAWNASTVNSVTVTGATIKSGTNENIVVTISDYGSFTVDINYNSEYQNNLNANYSVSITEADTPTTVAVTGVTLSPTTATLTVGGDPIALTATVAPDNATDKKVKWSVVGAAVKLYSDAECTTEIGADATDVLTVYAKGIAGGYEAEVNVTSNADSNKTASCAVTVNAASTTPTVTITPTGAGTVDLAWDSNHTNDLIFTAAANSGYEFDHWSYYSLSNSEWKEETSTSNPFTLVYYKGYEGVYKDFTAHFKATTVAVNDIDISNGTVTVNTSAKTVTVTVDGNTVPASAYHIIYFTYEKIDGGETLNRVGTDFPTTAGTYIAAVVANENSGYTGENRSKPFSVSGYKPEPTPKPYIPTYTHPVTPTTTEPEKQTEDIGTFEDITDEEENAGDAGIITPKEELANAVLDANDRAAMAKGSDVKVYLEVEKVEPTATEQALVDAAVAQIDDDIVVAMFLDIDLYKQVGNGSAVQMHETNGKIEVSIDLPDELKNTAPNVERTYYIARIHDGKVELIPATYDPETGKLSFLTDKFSMYAIAYVDQELVEGDDYNDDDMLQFDEYDLCNAIVYVTVESQNVTVRIGGGLVPADAYHVIFFTYDKIEGGESLTRVGNDFPTAPGTYIAAIVANEGSGFTGENRSDPFTVTGDVAGASEANPHTGSPLAGMGTFAALSFFAAAAAYTIKKRRK